MFAHSKVIIKTKAISTPDWSMHKKLGYGVKASLQHSDSLRFNSVLETNFRKLTSSDSQISLLITM
jgi:hypothetical protein